MRSIVLNVRRKLCRWAWLCMMLLSERNRQSFSYSIMVHISTITSVYECHNCEYRVHKRNTEAHILKFVGNKKRWKCWIQNILLSSCSSWLHFLNGLTRGVSTWYVDFIQVIWINTCAISSWSGYIVVCVFTSVYEMWQFRTDFFSYLLRVSKNNA